MRSWPAVSIVCLLLGAPGAGAEETKTPVEFGRVQWLRTIEAGQAAAEKHKRPMLVLFQEVPG